MGSRQSPPVKCLCSLGITQFNSLLGALCTSHHMLPVRRNIFPLVLRASSTLKSNPLFLCFFYPLPTILTLKKLTWMTCSSHLFLVGLGVFLLAIWVPPGGSMNLVSNNPTGFSCTCSLLSPLKGRCLFSLRCN